MSEQELTASRPIDGSTVSATSRIVRRTEDLQAHVRVLAAQSVEPTCGNTTPARNS